MDNKDILKFCLENGLLVDEGVLSLLGGAGDLDFAKLIIKKIKDHTQQKIITKEIFLKNREQVNKFFLDLPEESQKSMEKLKIKLGLSIEISKEISSEKILKRVGETTENDLGVKVLSKSFSPGKKYVVEDFVKHFRGRYLTLKKIIEDRQELKNLVSINKISGNGGGISVIGIVSDKRMTKNGNILFEIEDLTGKLKILVNQNKKEIFDKAQDISLDGVIGFRGSGNKEILFVNEIVFPDARLLEQKKSPVEEYAVFIGDIQCGSKLFMEENFLKFIDYLNGKIPNTPEAGKIKYLIIAGDIVDGIGVIPGQERKLKIKDLESQYARIAEILSKIRKNITIIISPGNHDCVRLMEPQPTFDEKYAWPIYNLKNVVLVGNPTYINIGARKTFSGINILIYHGFSYPYYANNVPSLLEEGNAMNAPEKMMKYLLKHRHLSPSHKATQSAPLEEDGMVIKEVPDVFVSAHTHKMAISKYNNILLISTATWESMSKHQERMGNKPDFCKVPMLNLRTNKIKILDFEKLKEESELLEKVV